MLRASRSKSLPLFRTNQLVPLISTIGQTMFQNMADLAANPYLAKQTECIVKRSNLSPKLMMRLSTV